MDCKHEWEPSRFNPNNLYCNKCKSWYLIEIKMIANADNLNEVGKRLIEARTTKQKIGDPK